jgi:hypothetical protein
LWGRDFCDAIVALVFCRFEENSCGVETGNSAGKGKPSE